MISDVQTGLLLLLRNTVAIGEYANNFHQDNGDDSGVDASSKDSQCLHT